MPRPTRRNTTMHLNGYEWWVSKTSKDGSQLYPESIRVGGRDNPRMYYPVDRDALLKLADEMDYGYKVPDVAHDYAKRIRRALGVEK